MMALQMTVTEEIPINKIAGKKEIATSSGKPATVVTHRLGRK